MNEQDIISTAVGIIILITIGVFFNLFDWVIPTLKLIGKISLGILILCVLGGIGYLIYYLKNSKDIKEKRFIKKKEIELDLKKEELKKQKEKEKNKKELDKKIKIEARIILTKVQKNKKNYLDDLDEEAKKYTINKWKDKIKEDLENGLEEEDIIELMTGTKQNKINKVNPLNHNEQLKLINAVGHKCENIICKNKHPLSVHHIVQRAEEGENKLNNLIVLCRNCHHHADRGGISKGEQKYWINKPNRFKYKINWKY